MLTDEKTSMTNLPRHDRRNACRESLTLFLRTYFPKEFRSFSDSQLAIGSVIVHLALKEGTAVRADLAFDPVEGVPVEPPAATSMVQAAALWLGLYRHKECITVVRPDRTTVAETMDAIWAALTTNTLIAADFPTESRRAQRMFGKIMVGVPSDRSLISSQTPEGFHPFNKFDPAKDLALVDAGGWFKVLGGSGCLIPMAGATMGGKSRLLEAILANNGESQLCDR